MENFVKKFKKVDFIKSEVIFKENDPVQKVYFVISGKVEVKKFLIFFYK
jgi:CRP-like cAMP-binding protein